jgi:hypothetical protein
LYVPVGVMPLTLRTTSRRSMACCSCMSAVPTICTLMGRSSSGTGVFVTVEVRRFWPTTRTPASAAPRVPSVIVTGGASAAPPAAASAGALHARSSGA